MSNRVAVLGLSGVGKSTLIKQVQLSTPAIHLQASTLIKSEQEFRSQRSEDSEALRTGDVLDNQGLLIAAFHRATKDVNLPIIFDGHSIIDGRDGLIAVPSSVFREFGLNAIYFLGADPEAIAERRRNDVDRDRPFRDVETLKKQQELAMSEAKRIATDVECVFVDISNGRTEALFEFLG